MSNASKVLLEQFPGYSVQNRGEIQVKVNIRQISYLEAHEGFPVSIIPVAILTQGEKKTFLKLS